VFVTHGEEESANAMAARIGRELRYGTVVPDLGETVNLSRLRK
jgi:hypothetical protein